MYSQTFANFLSFIVIIFSYLLIIFIYLHEHFSLLFINTKMCGLFKKYF